MGALPGSALDAVFYCVGNMVLHITQPSDEDHTSRRRIRITANPCCYGRIGTTASYVPTVKEILQLLGTLGHPMVVLGTPAS